LKNKENANVLVIIYLPHTNKFDYYYIPKKALKNHVIDSGTTLAFSYPLSGAEPSGWQGKYSVSLVECIK
jgi:hypothetical protein